MLHLLFTRYFVEKLDVKLMTREILYLSLTIIVKLEWNR